MAKTVILSSDTLQSLLEAHAALAAWYYEHAAALQRAGEVVSPPSAEQRRAHLRQIGSEFPEIGAFAASLSDAAPYVPTPVLSAVATVALPTPPPPAIPEPHGGAHPETRSPPEPAPVPPSSIALTPPETPRPASIPESVAPPLPAAPRMPGPPPVGAVRPPSTPPNSRVPPPPIVDPGKVKY